jgi:hypothetical protein
MATQVLTEPLKEGAVVKVLNSGFPREDVVEYRGSLDPKGARIYRVLAVKKPAVYMEVREDQLEVLSEP